MKSFLLLLATVLLPSAPVRAEEPVLVRLTGHQTSTPDGFHIRISSGSQVYLAQANGVPFDMIWFTIVVPHTVGKTDFAVCQLMIQDKQDRTLLSVPLGSKNDKFHREEDIQIQIKDKYTKGCELRFMYTARPEGYIAKEYILSVPDYLPATP